MYLNRRINRISCLRRLHKIIKEFLLAAANSVCKLIHDAEMINMWVGVEAKIQEFSLVIDESIQIKYFSNLNCLKCKYFSKLKFSLFRNHLNDFYKCTDYIKAIAINICLFSKKN